METTPYSAPGFCAAEKLLAVLFLLSLPFVTPRVRGDGIGYYAYARSLIVDHNLQFKGDWKKLSNEPFIVEHDRDGLPVNVHVTKTGHIANSYAVGPALLWAPFIAAAHGAVLILGHTGSAIPADGHSRPYLYAMAFGTALYGFLGLWLSFRLAREFVAEELALLATITIWFASSLPVYMYSDPSWSHAHSVFAVGLFLWYWHRTRNARARVQWAIWGLLSGLMCDVYFANGVFLLLPLVDLVSAMRKQAVARGCGIGGMKDAVPGGLMYAAAFLFAFLPTMIVREIIFGNPLATGAYSSRPWNWTSPRFWSVLASPSHGVLTSTPVIGLAFVGLVLLWRKHPDVGRRLLLLSAAFYALIAVDPWWDGTASFGNRFFISLTPIFVLGLAVAFEGFVQVWREPKTAFRRAITIATLLIVWNLGLVYQLDHGLFPSVGPVDWQEVVYNQFRIVPGQILHDVSSRMSLESSASEQSVRN